MKPIKLFLINALIAMCILFTNFCSQAEVTNDSSSNIVLVASTPGDSLIKSLLTIHPDTKVDFIRWDLTLKKGENDSKIFLLNIVFGEAQPNTLGFIGGGEKLTLEGKYTIFHNQKGNLNGEIYQLKSDKTPTTISIVKLNDNLFHLLTPDNNLMVGNDGWSYTLNRKEPLTNISKVLPSLTTSSSLPNDTARQVIFDGRTPCLDFAKQYNLPVDNNCLKLKWKLTLYRDPNTLLPTTYTLKRTLHRSSDIIGKWTIVKGSDTNPNVVIYQLDPDKPEESISFLIGDENVIFFLDKNQQLYVGNNNFSYTLNKRSK